MYESDIMNDKDLLESLHVMSLIFLPFRVTIILYNR